MAKKPTKWDIKKARKLFKDNDCELLEEVYINARTPMRYICICKRPAEIILDHFRRGVRCRKCMGEKSSIRQRKTMKEVKKIFKDGGCCLLSTVYKNSKTKMWYICSCDRLAQICLSHFQKGKRCKKCGIEKTSGKNHWKYNLDKTDEERIKGRKYPKYDKWRKKVYERDDYTCIITGERGGDLVAHHLEGYTPNRELRTVVSNGVTMDVYYHKLFHKLYGNGNNTRAQFEEFLKDYKEKKNILTSILYSVILPRVVKFNSKVIKIEYC